MVPEPAAETAGSFASVVGSSFEAALSTAGGVPTFSGALPTASVPTPRSAMAANELQGNKPHSAWHAIRLDFCLSMLNLAMGYHDLQIQ